MKFFKEENWIRDAFFACVLLALVYHVTKDENYNHVDVKKRTFTQQPFVAHEVDPEIIARIERLETQIVEVQEALKQLQAPTEHVEELENIQSDVQDIKKQYETTSPALAFLGPLGTTSVVLKEKKLEKRFLEQINRAIRVANEALHLSTEESVTTTKEGLDILDQKIRALHTLNQ